MGHPIHKHMHTHVTKSNVKAAIRDDKAHMDYLKRDVLDDQKYHAKDKDEKQTADEKHISKLAGDVKAILKSKSFKVSSLLFESVTDQVPDVVIPLPIAVSTLFDAKIKL